MVDELSFGGPSLRKERRQGDVNSQIGPPID